MEGNDAVRNEERTDCFIDFSAVYDKEQSTQQTPQPTAYLPPCSCL